MGDDRWYQNLVILAVSNDVEYLMVRQLIELGYMSS